MPNNASRGGLERAQHKPWIQAQGHTRLPCKTPGAKQPFPSPGVPIAPKRRAASFWHTTGKSSPCRYRHKGKHTVSCQEHTLFPLWQETHGQELALKGSCTPKAARVYQTWTPGRPKPSPDSCFGRPWGMPPQISWSKGKNLTREAPIFQSTSRRWARGFQWTPAC